MFKCHLAVVVYGFSLVSALFFNRSVEYHLFLITNYFLFLMFVCFDVSVASVVV